MRGSCGAACRRTVAPPSIDARPLNQLRPCVSIYSAKSFLSGAASARPRASRSHQFSGDRRRNKLFPDDGKCCIQRYVLQSLACPAKSGLAPSCVYRSDTSAARHWTTNYASPHQGKRYSFHHLAVCPVHDSCANFGLSDCGFQEPREVT